MADIQDPVIAERQRRLEIWERLKTEYGTKDLTPTLVRELGLYNGARGTGPLPDN